MEANMLPAVTRTCISIHTASISSKWLQQPQNESTSAFHTYLQYHIQAQQQTKCNQSEVVLFSAQLCSVDKWKSAHWHVHKHAHKTHPLHTAFQAHSNACVAGASSMYMCGSACTYVSTNIISFNEPVWRTAKPKYQVILGYILFMQTRQSHVMNWASVMAPHS